MERRIQQINKELIAADKNSIYDFREALKEKLLMKESLKRGKEQYNELYNVDSYQKGYRRLDHSFTLRSDKFNYIFSQPYASQDSTKLDYELPGYETYIFSQESQYNNGSTILVVYRAFK